MDLQSYTSFDGISKEMIALAFMTYIVDLGAYDLHPRDEKISNNFIGEC